MIDHTLRTFLSSGTSLYIGLRLMCSADVLLNHTDTKTCVIQV
jgi:hypothetical protein